MKRLIILVLLLATPTLAAVRISEYTGTVQGSDFVSTASEHSIDLGNSSDAVCGGDPFAPDGRTFFNATDGLLKTCVQGAVTIPNSTLYVSTGVDYGLSTVQLHRRVYVVDTAGVTVSTPISSALQAGAAEYCVEANAANTSTLCPHSADQIKLRGQAAETAGSCVDNSAAAAAGNTLCLRYVGSGLWRQFGFSAGTWAAVAAPPAAFCSGTYLFCYDADHSSGTGYAYTASGAGSINSTTGGSPTIDAAYGVAENGVLLDATGEYLRWLVTANDIVDTAEGTVTLHWNPRAATGNSYLFEVWQDVNNRIYARRNSLGQIVLVHQGNSGAFNSLTSDDTLNLTADNEVRIKWSVSTGAIGIQVRGGTWKTSAVTVSAFAAGTRYVYVGDNGLGIADATWVDNTKITGTYDE